MAVGPLHGTHEPPFYVCGSDQWVCGYMEGAVRTGRGAAGAARAHRRSRRRELVRLGHHAVDDQRGRTRAGGHGVRHRRHPPAHVAGGESPGTLEWKLSSTSTASATTGPTLVSTAPSCSASPER